MQNIRLTTSEELSNLMSGEPLSRDKCPDKSVIEAYLRGDCDDATADLIVSHLKLCSRCNLVAEQIEASPDTFTEQLRQARDDSAAAIYTLYDRISDGVWPGRAQCQPRWPKSALPRAFGPYRIDCILGYGGMGAVYKAFDTRLDRDVALKVPHEVDRAQEAQIARFWRESKAAARIAHPNICQVFDVGEIDNVPYITMAFIEGTSLAHYANAEFLLPESAVASIMQRIAEAMATAHRSGIVHRDLKPSNILLNTAGEPVVTDFGLARGIGDDIQDPRLTYETMLVGSPAYMAPEQVRCQHESIGSATDVYALGVVLYELLTGQLPFQGTVAEVLGRIISDVPTPPSHFRKDVNPELERICLHAMGKGPQSRLQSMDELASALSGYQDSSVRRDMGLRTGTETRSPLTTLLAICLLALATPFVWSWILPKETATPIAREPALSTVLILLPEKDLVIELDGDEYTAGQLAKPVTIPAGPHSVKVKRGRLIVTSKGFRTEPGENRTFPIQFKTAEVK
jgi:serine/threonine protein kinase